MNKIKIAIVAIGICAAVPVVKRVNRVIHDPQVKEAWSTATTDIRDALNQSYAKHYVESVIENLRKI